MDDMDSAVQIVIAKEIRMMSHAPSSPALPTTQPKTQVHDDAQNGQQRRREHATKCAELHHAFFGTAPFFVFEKTGKSLSEKSFVGP